MRSVNRMSKTGNDILAHMRLVRKNNAEQGNNSPVFVIVSRSDISKYLGLDLNKDDFNLLLDVLGGQIDTQLKALNQCPVDQTFTLTLRERPSPRYSFGNIGDMMLFARCSS